MKSPALIALILLVCAPHVATAQDDAGPFELGVQLPVVMSNEIDDTDVGVGGRVGWRPTSLFGVEAELNYFPGDAPRDGFSPGRTEGLFGMTVGPRIDRIRPFAKVRPGFVAFRGSSEPVACILIFPPPLSCILAEGHTAFALDLGGGVEVFMTPRSFLRLDVSNRMVRYPGPAFDADNDTHEDDFIGHELRLAVGGGWRF